jgi:hypothetical protein
MIVQGPGISIAAIGGTVKKSRPLLSKSPEPIKIENKVSFFFSESIGTPIETGSRGFQEGIGQKLRNRILYSDGKIKLSKCRMLKADVA